MTRSGCSPRAALQARASRGLGHQRQTADRNPPAALAHGGGDLRARLSQFGHRDAQAAGQRLARRGDADMAQQVAIQPHADELLEPAGGAVERRQGEPERVRRGAERAVLGDGDMASDLGGGHRPGLTLPVRGAAARRAECCRDLAAQTGHAAVQEVPGRGRRGAARAALQQPVAELRFEPGQRVRDRGL